MFNVRMCAICCPSGHLCFLHTDAICLSPIHPSFKYWLRDRLIGLLVQYVYYSTDCVSCTVAFESTYLMNGNVSHKKEKHVPTLKQHYIFSRCVQGKYILNYDINPPFLCNLNKLCTLPCLPCLHNLKLGQ